MTESDIRTKVVGYVRDAHAMEKNVEVMLGSMIGTTNDETLESRFEIGGRVIYLTLEEEGVTTGSSRPASA
jgi:hypothetical protein